jgi:hypothetical protein
MKVFIGSIVMAIVPFDAHDSLCRPGEAALTKGRGGAGCG